MLIHLDAVVLQGQPTNGPPPETTVYLSNVIAPRLGKRPTETTAATDSREFLRKKLVGHVVTFVKEYTAASGRDHGKIYLGGTNLIMLKISRRQECQKAGLRSDRKNSRVSGVPSRNTLCERIFFSNSSERTYVTVDYIQPKSEQFPEKTCCTVKVGELNIAEALILKGLSKVVRHRSDDENRSSEYDALLAAEANAEKSKKGLFADKTAGKKDTLRIQELQGDIARSKQFLPYLQRSTRAEGVVEFIASGSRLRIYIPKETVVITFLLGGISCPK
ncbi:unnamed protein product, partial [Cylicostephanus goldi]